jgi:hypothetical protein
MLVGRKLAQIRLALALTGNAGAREGAQYGTVEECFDAEVSARIIAQVPTVPQKFDDGSIVMHWPRFMDLESKRAYRGNIPAGNITALALRHTDLMF